MAEVPLSRQSETYPDPADLGGPLFVRSTRRVDLTPIGEVLFDEARRVLCAHSRNAGAPSCKGAGVDLFSASASR